MTVSVDEAKNQVAEGEWWWFDDEGSLSLATDELSGTRATDGTLGSCVAEQCRSWLTRILTSLVL